MLTKEEIEKRLERDNDNYTRLTKDRRVIYQRIKRYRNMLYHMNEMERELDKESVCD